MPINTYVASDWTVDRSISIKILPGATQEELAHILQAIQQSQGTLKKEELEKVFKDYGPHLEIELKEVETFIGQRTKYDVSTYVEVIDLAEDDSLIRSLTHLKNILSSKSTLPPLAFCFTGRKAELKLLQNNLEQDNSQPLVITGESAPTASHFFKQKNRSNWLAGTGGVGKTQLAIAYAQDAQARGAYQNILWFQGSNFIADFEQLARSFGLDPKELKLEDMTRYIYSQLSKRGTTLLIIDDISDYQLVKSYLPPQSTAFKVLFTSRNTNKDFSFPLVHLGVFKPEEAKEYIIKAFAQHGYEVSATDAEQLSQTLHYFPLALAQAVAYIIQKNIKVTTYLAAYHKKAKNLLSTTPFEDDPIRKASG